MLFSEGNLPHSDKIKTLIRKAGTSNLRYQVWKPVEYTSRCFVQAGECHVHVISTHYHLAQKQIMPFPHQQATMSDPSEAPTLELPFVSGSKV